MGGRSREDSGPIGLRIAKNVVMKKLHDAALAATPLLILMAGLMLMAGAARADRCWEPELIRMLNEELLMMYFL